MFDTTVPESCLIDTHCHLDAPEFAGRTDAVVGAARAAGVGQLLVPAVSQATFSSTLAMRARYGCWVALGLHPIYLDQHLDSHLDDLDRALALHRPDAVGEIGLDFYQPGLDPARQERLFVEQLRLARQHGLPVILHVRRAQDRVPQVLAPGAGGRRHRACFQRQPAAGRGVHRAGLPTGLWGRHDL